MCVQAVLPNVESLETGLLTYNLCVCAGRTAQCGVAGDRSAGPGTVAVRRGAAAGLAQAGRQR